ncbi:glycosyltransferase family 2 protein [Sphingosinicella sp. BN140058]|uniref:glycosyltransferase family 2 protein n=1 Tax=Sphingosinicella sp. BN140058 TaxID=1892855 RepID=UPI0010138B61|nr:glycosyltransferase family 2 protein [Sphingosinicella sp. BN140058]QAY76981.1 glycosyltransferase family 2 protein [Sphingosinicella sp. BN140058]
MRELSTPEIKTMVAEGRVLQVSIVMPCLNESECLEHCILNARAALAEIDRRFGLAGEIVIADNGSTDGSQALATRLGARVVAVAARGYGAALIGGAEAAFGRYILMGDADGSYDFTDGVAMIGCLHAGADLCMGSRFRGGIAPGAMPWKNRHIGNPVLTGLLNILFRSGIGDAHCGLRAIRKESFLALKLTGTGMEFASEMVIKAALLGLRIDEVPAKLLVDKRSRAPHLRPWRDGWRHLRYLFMLSPTWLFAAPAILAVVIAAIVLGGAALGQSGAIPLLFGSAWTMLAGGLLGLGHLGLIMALASHIHGVRSGFRRRRPFLTRAANVLNLETMLITGAALALLGAIGLGSIAALWSAEGFTPLDNTLPLVLAVVSLVIGCQTILGGFLLAVVGGNEAAFLKPEPAVLPTKLEILRDRAA